mmetsp:Transcript_22073/g.27131  ORF Transcript_22073/g.27131 Transcript_22073/m.27131 type:complete len:99 (-) Transcript_22073:1282-1578(-)
MGVSFLIIALLLGNLAFIIMNIVRYLYPLQVKSVLLKMYYILATVLTVSRILELAYISNPHDKCTSIVVQETKGQTAADFIATFANVAICCLFMATMY